MQAGADKLLGRHDFTTFRSAHCQANSPLRTLDRLDVTETDDGIAIHVSARSFLHHQVRSMVGCLALVGQRSEEHTSELQSLMRISYAVFCLKKKKNTTKR